MKKLFFGLLEEDINEIYESSSSVWQDLKCADILVMGGTGFVGKWIVASMGYAINQGNNIKITVISRHPKDNYKDFTSASFPIDWVESDLSKQTELNLEKFTHIINAATPSSALTGSIEPRYVFESISGGNDLILTSKTNPKLRYVHLSSGAVTALESLEQSYEKDFCADNHLQTLPSAYSHGKRFAEEAINKARQEYNLNAQSLRLYAFAGPGLPTDQHYAAGNFMRDGMRNLPIEIKGNPHTKRSYMYPADLTRHILNSLVSREVTTREVGSKEIISIGGLARVISENTNNSIVTKGDATKPYSVYLPRTRGLLSETISLEESIQRWREWLSSLKNLS